MLNKEEFKKMIDGKIRPTYIKDADYTTNAPSFYDYLARNTELLQLLAERIWGYDEEINEYFKRWEDNLATINEDVINMMIAWLDDGTLDHVINETLMNKKADKVEVEALIEIINTYETLMNKKADKKHLEMVMVNVKEFGADIEKDSTIAIQNAIDYVFLQGGGSILIDDIYPISKIFIKSNIRLYGYSSKTCGLKHINSSPTVDYRQLITIGESEKRHSNIIIENLLIDGGRENEIQHSQTNHGISLTNSDNVKIIGCDIRNNHGDGIWVGFFRPNNILVENNYFTNNGRVGFVVVSTEYGIRLIDNVFYKENAVDIEQDGYDLSTGSKGIIVDGNTFIKCNKFAIVTAENVIAEENSSNHVIKNNVFYHCEHKEDDLFTLTSYNLIFENNRFYNCKAKRYFFYSMNTHKIVFKSNIFSKCVFGEGFFYLFNQDDLGTQEGIFTNNIMNIKALDPNFSDGIAIFYTTSSTKAFSKSIINGNTITTNVRYFSYGDTWRKGSVINGNSITTDYIGASYVLYTVEEGSHVLINGNSFNGFTYTKLSYNTNDKSYSKISHSNTKEQKYHESFELNNNETFIMTKNGIKYEIYLDDTGTLQTRGV